MNAKTLIPLLSLLTMASNVSEPMNFQYRFQVIGNSYHPFDQSQIYYYKEQLIDKYESLVFGFDEREYGNIISNNIESFKFDRNCISTYRNGEIVLIIGKGSGPIFKGDLRRNTCDESAIREKIYIFELFQ